MDTEFERIDMNQCPQAEGNPPPNYFAGTDRCKGTTMVKTQGNCMLSHTGQHKLMLAKCVECPTCLLKHKSNCVLTFCIEGFVTTWLIMLIQVKSCFFYFEDLELFVCLIHFNLNTFKISNSATQFVSFTQVTVKCIAVWRESEISFWRKYSLKQHPGTLGTLVHLDKRCVNE